jgi:hypothetical protein
MWHPIKVVIQYTVTISHFAGLPTLLVQDTNQRIKDTWTLNNGILQYLTSLILPQTIIKKKPPTQSTSVKYGKHAFCMYKYRIF